MTRARRNIILVLSCFAFGYLTGQFAPIIQVVADPYEWNI